MNFEDVHKKLKNNFFIAISIALMHVGIGYLLAQNVDTSISVNIERILKTVLLLYILISIPLNFSFFNKTLCKIKKMPSYEKRINRYIKASRLRILIFLVGLISAIMFFFLRKMNDMIYLIAIEVTVLLFCLPTANRLHQEMSVFIGESKESEEQI